MLLPMLILLTPLGKSGAVFQSETFALMH